MKNRNTDLAIEGGNNRRQFLKLAGFGTLGLASGGLWPLLNFSTAGQIQETIPATEFRPDLDISLTARPGEVSIFPGTPTKLGKPGDPGGLRGAEPGVAGRRGGVRERRILKAGALDRAL